jgi:hypothetical protein
MVEGGELQAQKQCEFKLLSTAPQSCAYKTSNPRAMCGLPLGIKPRYDLEKKQLMKKEWWLKPRLTP